MISSFCILFSRHHNQCAFYSPANAHSTKPCSSSILSAWKLFDQCFLHIELRIIRSIMWIDQAVWLSRCTILIFCIELSLAHLKFEEQAWQLGRAQSRDWSAVWNIRKRTRYLIPTKSPYHFVRGVWAKFEFRYESLQSKFSLILFAYILMVGWSKQNLENYPSKFFWSKQKIACENIRLSFFFAARR